MIVVAGDRAGCWARSTAIFIAYVGIPSFVATLAMLFFLDGLALIISHSEQITTPGTAVTHTTSFARVFGAGTYSELIWAVGIVIILQIVLVVHPMGDLHGRGGRQPASARPRRESTSGSCWYAIS